MQYPSCTGQAKPILLAGIKTGALGRAGAPVDFSAYSIARSLKEEPMNNTTICESWIWESLRVSILKSHGERTNLSACKTVV